MPKTGSWRGPTKSVSTTDIWDRALGSGDPTSSRKSVGKENARWASIPLTGGAAVQEYDLPHDLGQVPTVVTLESYENARGPVTITARGVRQSNWSHSHAHVEVTLIAGSLDGCRATFRVSGR